MPERESGTCQVCGQEEEIVAVDPTEIALLERDASAREVELTDLLERYETSLVELQRDRNAVATQKVRVDRELNDASTGYDSAYLSNLLSLERERAALLEQAQNLAALSRLPEAVQRQRDELQSLIAREAALREEHKEARTAAERDSENLDRLKALFLDCLLRAEIPGITSDDAVEIRTPAFLPEVYVPDAPNATVTSFSNMSSGGKKTLFKCCFAIAVHRLAREVGATLPEFLLIDSPMKNISERENREQFEGFHRMIYDLKATELQSTQIILIDKEYCPPTQDQQVEVQSRHMRPNDPDYPPLIPYYHGH